MDDPTYYLEERYATARDRSRLLSAYYAVRPVVPRRAQLALRRVYARRQMARAFPAWPIETVLLEQEHERLRSQLAVSGAARIPFVNYWPHGRRFCAVLTHDVEGDLGIRNIDRVLEIEQRHGFVSAWYVVAEDYHVPDDTLPRLRAAGCEVGVHGIHHDGMLFRSRRDFDANLPKIGQYLDDWDAVGFRSPSLHRNAEWMKALPALYDSSFPDTDPFEPQAGGCCSIFPYFLGDVVELPVTLVQDHTLLEILRERSPARWIAKADWIARQHGLVNIIVHPDYMTTQDRLDMYEEFLRFLSSLAGCWHALPRDVARWWRARAELVAAPDPVAAVARRPELGATVAHASQSHDRIVFDV